MKDTIDVHCDCGEYYSVKYVNTIKAQANILDYAICPHCGTKRNPAVWKDKTNLKQCHECHIPCKKLTDGLCTLHYMRRYRNSKKLQRGSN